MSAGEAIGRVASKPFVWTFRAASPLMGQDEAFRALSEHIALLPGPLGIVIRRAVYRQVLAHVGRNVSIGFGTVIAHRTAEFGDNVYVGRFCLLGDVRIGDGCLLADHVRVVSGKHNIVAQVRRLVTPINPKACECGGGFMCKCPNEVPSTNAISGELPGGAAV